MLYSIPLLSTVFSIQGNLSQDANKLQGTSQLPLLEQLAYVRDFESACRPDDG